MERQQHLCVCILLAFCLTGFTNGGKVLVWYADASHWINLKPILETLVDRGHAVTVLVPSMSLYMDTKDSKFQYEVFEVSATKEDFQKFMDELFYFFIYEMERLGYVEIFLKFSEVMKENMGYIFKCLDGVVKSEPTMKSLKEKKFDILLADPVFFGSELVADILGIPLIYSLRFSMVKILERQCGQLPAPPSFVPAVMTRLTDRMDFLERVWNFGFYLVNDWAYFGIWREVNSYYSQVKGTPSSACDMVGKTEIWLIRNYWDMDFPHPILPNFKYVGGIHCRPAKPLPEDIEEFVQSSGEDGVVVFSLGTFITNLTKEQENVISSALAQIPQKVVWGYKGEKPQTLGANTRIYKWIPQNDLLGHPKTRAFVTHGGANGVYEAIYHGVPMMGIPLVGDQPSNMVQMKSKGAALFIELKDLTTENLRDSITTVINDPSYKANAMRLSRIHHDRPMSPCDEAIFWIEYIMRNKEAKHLRVQAHELTWYQYHSLDVLVFLLSIVLLTTILFIKICKICFRWCCGSRRKRKTE